MQEHEFEYEQEEGQSSQQQGQRQQSGCSSTTIALLGLALLVLGGLAAMMSLGGLGGGKPTMTPLTGYQTTAGTAKFDPLQDAIWRLQETNQYRIDAAATVSANNATVKAGGSGQIQQLQQGNLGLAELVAQYKDGSTALLFVSAIHWGYDSSGHSEALSAHDVLDYINTHTLDSNIKGFHLLVVTQYNPCGRCQGELRSVTDQIQNILGNAATIRSSLWMVKRYIDPLNPKTWIAPQSRNDISLQDVYPASAGTTAP